MRTHLEFRSSSLLDKIDSEDQSSGEKVAKLLASKLPAHGFSVEDVIEEDWGWCVMVQNALFPLWVGTGHYLEYDDGHLTFIEPSKPFVRRWLRKIPTEATVERLANALQAIITDSGKAGNLRWWTESEVSGH